MSVTEDTVMTMGVEQHDLLDYEPVKTPTLDQDTLSNTMKTDHIYSCYKMLPILWEDVVDTINYHDLSKHSYHQMMYVIHDDIRDKIPKWMTICCFDQVALTLPNKTILEGCKEMIKLVEAEGIHKLSFGTIQFPPEHQSKWEKIGKLNSEIRLLNIDRNIPPLALHKALMKHMFDNNTGPLMIKGYMWEQFIKKTGLGETISFAGMKKMKSFLVQAVQKQFLQMNRPNSKRWLGTCQPPPLCATDEYKDDWTMCRFLREKGEDSIASKSSKTSKVPPKSASTSNIPATPVVPQPTGASANPTGATNNDQNRPRPATWYGEDYQVNYQPLDQIRNVVVREDDCAFDAVFSEEKENSKRNYNESENNDSDLRLNIEKRKSRCSIDKEIEAVKSIQNKAIKAVQDRATNTKTNEEFTNEMKSLNKEVSKLNKYLDTEEAQNKDLKKQVQKLKLDNEALLIEKDCLLTTQLRQDREIRAKDEQLRLLEENYTFLKNMHDDRTAWIKENRMTKKN